MLQQQLYQEGQEKPTWNENQMNRYNSYHQQNSGYNYNQGGYNQYYNNQRSTADNNGYNSFYNYGSSHNQSFTNYSAYRSLYEGNGGNYRNRKYIQNGYNGNSYSSTGSQQQCYNGRQSPYNNGLYNAPPPTTGYKSEGDADAVYPHNSFCPITSPSPCPSSSSTGSSSTCEHLEPADWDSISGPVELLVSNLDYNISAKEWRKILFTTFHPHVRVCKISTYSFNLHVSFPRLLRLLTTVLAKD